MVEYMLSDDDRAALARYHRTVQAAIAVVANRHRGIDAEPEGIFKWEGGVRVDERDIVVYGANVQDRGRRRTAAPTVEEQAAAAAITFVARLFKKRGPTALAEYGVPRRGDPLRSMFEGIDLE